jgi:hypothetical protein
MLDEASVHDACRDRRAAAAVEYESPIVEGYPDIGIAIFWVVWWSTSRRAIACG